MLVVLLAAALDVALVLLQCVVNNFRYCHWRSHVVPLVPRDARFLWICPANSPVLQMQRRIVLAAGQRVPIVVGGGDSLAAVVALPDGAAGVIKVRAVVEPLGPRGGGLLLVAILAISRGAVAARVLLIVLPVRGCTAGAGPRLHQATPTHQVVGIIHRWPQNSCVYATNNTTQSENFIIFLVYSRGFFFIAAQLRENTYVCNAWCIFAVNLAGYLRQP